MSKYGSYIQKLMTTVLDKEQDEFVQQLAWVELKRLRDNVGEFLVKHSKDDSEEQEKTEKILLQETKNGTKSKKEN